MQKINISKLSNMVGDFLKEENIDTLLDEFSIEGNSQGFIFANGDIEIVVKTGMTMGITGANVDYSYSIVLNRRKEKRYS